MKPTENKGSKCLVDRGLPNNERLGQGYTHCTMGDKVENSKYRSSVPSHDGYFYYANYSISHRTCENNLDT